MEEETKALAQTDTTVKNVTKSTISDKWNDAVLRQNIFRTICLYSATLAMSAAKGLIGPTFLDIQAICGVGFDAGIWILTARSLGFMSGAILSGNVLDRCLNNDHLLAMTSLLLGVSGIAIPWCSVYAAMVVTYYVWGLCMGIIETECNAQIFVIWKRKGKTYLQILHFVWSLGMSISPIYVIPFLSQNTLMGNIDVDGDNITKEMYLTTLSHNNSVYIDNNASLAQFGNLTVSTDSNILVPFCITGGLGLISAFLFLVYIARYTTTTKEGKGLNILKENRNLPLPWRVLVMVFVGLLLLLFAASVDTVASLLTTFCVEYLDWSKANGSLLTSLYMIGLLVGRLISIFSVNKFSPQNLLGIQLGMAMIVIIAMAVSAHFKFQVGIWITLPLIGFSHAPVIACLMSWVDDTFIPVSGQFTSFVFICLITGATSSPVVTGYMMKHWTLKSFYYLLFIYSISLLLMLAILSQLAKMVKRRYGSTYGDTKDISVTVVLNNKAESEDGL